MDITNDNDINYKLARAKIVDLKKAFGIVLRVSSESIGVLKPLIISDGICFKFTINTKTSKKTEDTMIRKNEMNKFKDSMNNSNNMARLIKEFNKSWNLDSSTKINSIDIKYMESIKRSKNTVKIKMDNLNMNSIQKQANNLFYYQRL